MEKLPVMKELMDMYCGPDRVTAKEQQEELERVAKTLPENIPSSVKRFTDRALLSLQVCCPHHVNLLDCSFFFAQFILGCKIRSTSKCPFLLPFFFGKNNAIHFISQHL